MHSKPKKSLSQNFLIDKNIRGKIITSCVFKSSDVAVEIGAGSGELTAMIAGQVKKLYAVEIDKRLYPVLSQRLALHSNASIVKANILKFDLKSFLRDEGLSAKIKVFGNIPYNISSPLLEYFIDHRNLISEIFITVQKEFAARVVAVPGSKVYGSLSCFAQYYFEPQIVFNIRKNSFFPVPKVDSTFLKLKVRKEPNVRVDNEDLFFKVIRAAFNKRRKTLRNSLEGVVSKEILDKFFTLRKLNPNIRPDDLSLEDFGCLSGFLTPLAKP